MITDDAALFLRDGAVPLWKKCVGLFAAFYVLWPLDLIPDAIPIFGWLDDLGVVALCSWYFVREVRKHAAARANSSPRDRGTA